MTGSLSPLDYRYAPPGSIVHDILIKYLGAEASLTTALLVEETGTRVLSAHGLVPIEAALEIERACQSVNLSEVEALERSHGHQTIAMVEAIRNRVSPAFRGYVHLFATSSDIQDTALALRLRDLAIHVLLPKMAILGGELVRLTRAHAETPQIGRTHGQHAQPITFGFAVALFIDRLGHVFQNLQECLLKLTGKFSGSVGAFGTLSLFDKNPNEIEDEILTQLSLPLNGISSQIVKPEPLLDYVCVVTACVGLCANIADDWRHLARPEIGEVRIIFRGSEMGSSAMPHKDNPWIFEHIKSLWKVLHAMVGIPFGDLISEHQRDLTNSASRRFVEEALAIAVCTIESTIEAARGLDVRTAKMRSNISEAGDFVCSEYVKVALAMVGDPDPDTTVRQLVRAAVADGASLRTKLLESELIMCKRIASDPRILQILDEPIRCIGKAQEIAMNVCDTWSPTFQSVIADF